MKYKATIDDMEVEVEFDDYDYDVPIIINGKSGFLNVVGYLVRTKENWEELGYEYSWFDTIAEAVKCYDHYKKECGYYEVVLSYNNSDRLGKEHLEKYRLEHPKEEPKKAAHVCKCSCGKQVHSLWEGLEE